MIDPRKAPCVRDEKTAFIVTKALDEIGLTLDAQGLSLEEMIVRGRKVREELFREQYDGLNLPRSEGLPLSR